MKLFFALFLLASLTEGNILYAQTQSPYKLPDSYRFDYEVSQVLVSKKNAADSSVIHFFYTKSGDYAAAKMSRKDSMKGNLFVVLTQDGNCIIFDDRRKDITIVSIRKLVSDLYGLTKWIRMDSLIANLRGKTEGRQFQSVKTGNTMKVGSYTSEEYRVSDGKGNHSSVWCAKVDFNTAGDYMLGAVGGNLLKMMTEHLTTQPLFQALTQPKTMVTAMDIRDSADGKGMNMNTTGLSQISSTVPTSGYQVNNYSNMTLQDIFHEEMRKRNH